MTNANEKLAKLIRIVARRQWPFGVTAAELHVKCEDGKELDIPVYMGVVPGVTPRGTDGKTKEKLFAAAPAKSGVPVNFKKLCRLAAVSPNRHSRTMLRELVDDGDIERIGNDYRKST